MFIESTFIQSIINNFKYLLCERFFNKIIKVQLTFFDVKLNELRQKSNESLIAYYKRIINLMYRVEIKNRSIFTSIDINIFSLLKFAILNTILRVFIKKLLNSKIRKKATRNIINLNKSLRSIYQLIEKTRRINFEIQKLFDEKLKLNELFFYKQLIMKNLSRTKINILLTQYYAIKIQS